jgi:hypothetical protein
MLKKLLARRALAEGNRVREGWLEKDCESVPYKQYTGVSCP